MSDHSTSGSKEKSPMLVKVTKPGAEELGQVHTLYVAHRPAQAMPRNDTAGAYWRKGARRRWSQVALMFVLAVTAGAAPATAVGDRYYGHDTSYAGSGTQFGAWDESDRELRLKASSSSQMSPSRCMDAMLDWRVENQTNHYDSRFVRSCQPGWNVSTDPGTDDYWNEPQGWEGGTPNGMRIGWGLVWGGGDPLSKDAFEDSGAVQSDPDPVIPSTYGQGWARIRTRYQSGQVEECQHYPRDTFEDRGCN